jgi:hypothetical protein
VWVVRRVVSQSSSHKPAGFGPRWVKLYSATHISFASTEPALKSAVGPGNVHEGKRPLLELLACLYNALQVVATVCKRVVPDEPLIL